MSPPLHYSVRWAPWYVALVTAMVASPFIGVALYCSVTPEPWPLAARIAITISLPALYLALQVAFNKRYVTVTPDGVRVSNAPFPGGVRRNIRRDQIASCYLRQIVDYTDGIEVDRYFLVGVRFEGSKVEDVSGPIRTEMEAREVAYKIRGVLNAHPSAKPVDVSPVPGLVPTALALRLLFVAWFLLFVLALVIGAAWELNHVNWQRSAPL